jgi:hypothetical protein
MRHDFAMPFGNITRSDADIEIEVWPEFEARMPEMTSLTDGTKITIDSGHRAEVASEPETRSELD